MLSEISLKHRDYYVDRLMILSHIL